MMLEFTFASERAELGLFGTSRGFALVCTRKYENIYIDSNSLAEKLQLTK